MSDQIFFILFAILILWMSPIPWFTEKVIQVTYEFNQLLPEDQRISMRSIKTQALIFGIFWPIYCVILLLMIIKSLLFPNSNVKSIHIALHNKCLLFVVRCSINRFR